MAIDISRNSLESSVVRNRVLSTLGGERTIDVSNAIVEQSEDVGFIRGIQNNLFEFTSGIIGNRAASLLFKGTGWIVGAFGGFLSLSVSSLWAWGQEAFIKLYTFDWNQTDEELLQQNKGSESAIASVWGSAFGGALGWTAGVGLGYGVGLAVPVIGSKALAATLSSDVFAEGIEETSAQIKGALRVTLSVLTENATRSLFVSGRKFIRDAQVAYAQQTYGDEAAREILENQSAATSWGGDAAPVWSFASKSEETIEKLPGNWRVFAAAAADEFGDAVFEAGYLIANGLDRELAARKTEKLANPERGVVLYPDRESPDERIVLLGEQSEMKAQVQGSLDTYRQLRQKDVGEIVGFPSYEVVTPATSRRTLTIVYASFDRPPFTRSGQKAKRSTMTIPDAKTGISFNELKVAFRPYTFGGQRVGCRLSNGRQLAAYGQSDSEAEEMLRALLLFTTAEPVSYVYTDTNKGVPVARRKEIEVRYPYKATMRTVRGSVELGTQRVTEESMLLWRDEPVQIDRFT